MLLQGARPADYPQPHFFADIERVDDPVVRRVVLLMEQSMNEFRPVSWFAHRAGVSVRQLERRFARALDVTPATLFRRLRLDYAASLLKRTDMPVMDIAIDCGFVDGAHMARDFKERFNATPTCYRVQTRADASEVSEGGF